MRTHAIFVAALLLLNIVLKYSLWIQPPQTFTDSLSYLAPATSLLDGRGYGSQENGYRTPVYPLFLAAILLPFDHHGLSQCREARVPACLGDIQYDPGPLANLRTIAWVQIVLGAITIALVYWFAWAACRSCWIAALCALTYPIDLSTGYWEISILTEALTIFLLMLAVCLTLVAARASMHRTLPHVALGVVLAALAMCQPIYLLYVIVPAAFLVIASTSRNVIPGERSDRGISFSHRYNETLRGVYTDPEQSEGDCARSDKEAFRDAQIAKSSRAANQFPRHLSPVTRHMNVLFVLVIPGFFVLAWSARNYYVDGFFTPSTLTGYNLTQMVGPFMEQAPVQYHDLAEIYVDTREERIAARGNHSGTIFLAYPEMIAARKTTWAGLSRELTDLSLQLIQKNPPGYLQVASESFDQFWKFGLGRQNPGLPASFDWLRWFFDARFQQAAMILFFLSPIALVLARNSERDTTWIWFAIATVWFVTIISSALNFGDNERYRAPVARLQYSAIILTAYVAVQGQHTSLQNITRRLLRKPRSSQ